MHRYFCMFDTIDTLPGDNRLVINARTTVNLPQAIAEGIVADPGDPKEIEKALVQSADYLDTIWLKMLKPDIEIFIHIESGDVEVLSPVVEKYTDRFPSVKLKEHQFNHPPVHARCMLDQHQELWMADRPVHLDDVDLYQQRFEIYNRDENFNLPEERVKYYAREEINWNIMVTKIIIPHMNIITISRKCELLLDFQKDWKKCAGAVVRESVENQLPDESSSLKLIRPGWEWTI